MFHFKPADRSLYNSTDKQIELRCRSIEPFNVKAPAHASLVAGEEKLSHSHHFSQLREWIPDLYVCFWVECGFVHHHKQVDKNLSDTRDAARVALRELVCVYLSSPILSYPIARLLQ